MENLNKNMVKEILSTIQSEGIIGFRLLSILKERNPDFNETVLYSTLKTLTEHNCIDNYIANEDKNCKVKIQYKLSEQGKILLNSL